ncbi:MAG: UvrD-helicase domain-containing protein [Muribaculaceae bacterium]|nr:UvrD-helicase domain-containing protein [Muribaculaceae bacterium]
MEDYLNKLNPQQRDAVLYCDGPQLVIAGAGSGKTRVLTYKIVHLLKLGYFPSHIMALTFTNKAAGEMRERIQALVGEEVSSHLWMGTFHSIFAKLLRINADRIGFDHDFTIYDTSDSRSLIKLIIKDMQLDDKVYKPATIQSRISMMKNALITPSYYESRRELREEDERAKRPMTAEIYKTYCHRCKIAGAMDFDDLLVYTNILLRDNPEILKKYQERFEYILVDEYQDTNFAQHLIITQLAKSHNHVCVVGDDAQSIYSFRGANISNILDLKKSFPTLQTFKLERNYRSTQNIIGAANSLIDKNKRQIKKNIYSENPVGTKVNVVECYNDYEEAYVVASTIMSLKAREGCSYEDFAVLYRTNAQSRVLEEALGSGGLKNKHGDKRRPIPYRIYGGLSFYQRKEIKDALAYFRLTINPNDDEALRRVINYPARGIGATTMAKVQHCGIEGGVSMWQVLNNPQQHRLDVNNGTMRKLQAFVELINGFAAQDQSGVNAYELGRTIIERSGIMAELMKEKSVENISKQENLNELLSAIHDFVEEQEEQGSSETRMTDFLAQASLATDQDTDKSTGECVTLMTVHAAKGLEYKNVIIVGVEEDLFPSAMSKDSLAAIEEERRLLYVAITRAEKNCVISFAKSRFRNGSTQNCQPSRFLRDIDPQFLSMGATSSNKSKSEDSHDDFRTERHRGFESLRSEYTAPTSPRPQPSFKPVSQSTPPSASASSGDFTLHSLSEISEGSLILHNKFGEGTITKIDTSGSDPKIIVEFDVMGQRTLLLKFAKFKIL